LLIDGSRCGTSELMEKNNENYESPGLPPSPGKLFKKKNMQM
jgi:hypothetical protein